MKLADRYLGEAYAAHQQGDLKRAAHLYARVLQESPEDADALNLLGLLHLQREHPGEAVPYLRRADQAAPGNPETTYNLGLALLGSDEPVAAKDSFLRSAGLAPKNPEPLVAAANVSRQLGARDAAVEDYRKALGLDAGHTGARTGLSLVCNEDGIKANADNDPARALELFREAVSLDDNHAEAWLNLGILEEQLGHLDDAAESLQNAIRLDNKCADAHFHLAHLRQHPSSPGEISAMKALFDTGNLEVEDRITVAYGIARSLEKQEEFDAEFDWLERAHMLQKVTSSFDESADIERFEQLRTAYCRDVFENIEHFDGKGLVFVVGMPRSGTSLAEHILASHSAIYGAGESLTIASSSISPRSGNDLRRRTASDIEQRIRRHASGATLAVETTPGNYLHVGRIALLFPKARIIHCTRDARDTCLSIYQQPLSSGHGYAHDLATLGRFYNRVQSLMEHWKSVVPNPHFELRYESVVGSFESTVHTLLDFCGVEFEDSCLRFFDTSRQVRTPSASQVRQPIYRSSIGRWQRYEKRLEPLLDALA